MFTVSSTKQATASLLQFPGVSAFVTPIYLQVAYAECIIKLIREAKFWPRRHAWISFDFYEAVFAAYSTEAGISRASNYEAPLRSMLRHEIFFDCSCPVLMLSRLHPSLT